MGGGNPPIGQEIACHFSQDHAMVTKILDFIHKHLNYKVLNSFFDYHLGLKISKMKINWSADLADYAAPVLWSFHICCLTRDVPANDNPRLLSEIKRRR